MMLYGLGVLVVAIGICYRLFPPKSIDCFYAHKTKLARTNDDTWEEAQKFGRNSMLATGLLMFASGLICYNVLGMSDKSDHNGIVGVVIVLMLGMMAANELHLKRLFHEDGSRKSAV